MSGAPYGYRFVKKTEHTEGYWEIDEIEAGVVREVFRRYTEEQALDRRARPLADGAGDPDPHRQAGVGSLDGLGDAAQPRLPRPGRLRQDARSPTGTASRRAPPAHAASATAAGRPASTSRPSSGRSSPSRRSSPTSSSRSRRQRLATQRALRQAQHQAADAAAGHARLPRVRLRLLPHLARARPTSGSTTTAASARTTTATSAGASATAARSAPTSSTSSSGTRSAGCSRTPRSSAPRSTAASQALRDRAPRRPPPRSARADLTRAGGAIERLIEAYQEQLISLDELRARMPALRKRQSTLQAQLDALEAELHDAETYLKLADTLEGFLARLSRRPGPARHSTNNNGSCGSSSAKS